MSRLSVSHSPARPPTEVLEARPDPRFRPIDYTLALIAGGLALTLYIRTLAPGLLGGDSGEFQFAAWLAGFAHPTGYPLYLMLGYIWSHLLWGSTPAWRMNLLSAVWGGVAGGLVYLLAFRLFRLAARKDIAGTQPSRRWSVVFLRALALFVALTFSVTPTFWSQAIIAEAYTLHAAFVAAVLLGLVTWAELPPHAQNYGPLYRTAAIYGLSLTHHLGMLLLIPAIVIYLWQDRRWGESWRLRLGGLARAVVLLTVPLLLYLYVPLRAPQAPYAQIVVGPEQALQLYESTARGFFQYVTGQVFSSAIGTATDATRHLWPSIQLFVHEVSWAGIILGLLGLAWLVPRARPMFTLTGLSFLGIVGFNLFYGIGDIYVFYIPAYLIWTLWMAMGVVALGQFIETVLRLVMDRRQRLFRGFPPLRAGLPALLIASILPAWLLFGRYAQIDQSQNHQPRSQWESLLARPIPQDAILVSNDRDEMIPLWYLQYVEGVRTDITGLFPLIQTTPEWEDVGRVIDAGRRSGRPVMLVKPMPGLEIKYLLEQAGALTRVVGPAVTHPPDHSLETAFGDAIRLNGYDLEPSLVGEGDEVTVSLYWQPLRTEQEADYTTFVHLINAEGDIVGQSDHLPGGVYYPTRFWQPGELLKDVHTLFLASNLGRPPFTVEVGLYTMTDELHHLGNPERIGMVGLAQASTEAPEDLTNRLDYLFDSQIALNGYELGTQGRSLTLRLYWQALAAPAADYTVFVHLLGLDGTIVAQRDQQPAKGAVPTSTWSAGYTLVDEVTISLPDNLPPGNYPMIAGLYDSATQVRLPVADGQGVALGNSVPLGDLTWQPSP